MGISFLFLLCFSQTILHKSRFIYVLQDLKTKILSKHLEQANSFHELSRINLIFNIFLLGLSVGVVGSILVLSIGATEILMLTIPCIVFPLLCLFWLTKTKNYETPAVVFLYIWIAGLIANVLFFNQAVHLVTFFWIIIANILTIYLLGIKHGIVTLFISVSVFIYYIEFGFFKLVENYDQLNPEAIKASYGEAIMATVSLGYILWLIIENSKKSDKLLAQKNETLRIQNETIKSSNDEKTVMLKEIHHRVKNNLQVITSLLRLQMDELKEDEANAKFKESINRIITMSLIHEKMYQSDKLTQINLEDYFKNLSDDLIRSYAPDKKGVSIHINCEVVHLDMRTMVPLALAFHELLSNSLKHAFSDTPTPEVFFNIKQPEEQTVLVEYTDTGKWKTTEKESSLGLELINSFVDQLDGSLTFENEPQTRYTFSFNLQE